MPSIARSPDYNVNVSSCCWIFLKKTKPNIIRRHHSEDIKKAVQMQSKMPGPALVEAQLSGIQRPDIQGYGWRA